MSQPITSETVQQIIRGSENIDQMRIEIRQIIKMIIGLVTREKLLDRLEKGEQPALVFPSDECAWGIGWRLTPGGQEQDRYWLQCVVRTPMGFIRDGCYYLEREEIVFSDPQLIQLVHEGLPIFVKGMIDTFPELADRLQTFLRAADAF